MCFHDSNVKINPANSPTINAANAIFIMLNNYTAPTSITDITGGITGQELIVYMTNANVTFVHNAAKIRLSDKTNFNVPTQTAMKFVCIDGTIWSEV